LFWCFNLDRFTYTDVTEACSLEDNALKTKSRTINASVRNTAQNSVRLWQIASVINAENFVQKLLHRSEDIKVSVVGSSYCRTLYI